VQVSYWKTTQRFNAIVYSTYFGNQISDIMRSFELCSMIVVANRGCVVVPTIVNHEFRIQTHVVFYQLEIEIDIEIDEWS